MSTGIKVINKKHKKKTKGIISILKAIGCHNISDAVGVQALKTFTDVVGINNVHISDCHIVNGKKLNN